MPSDNFMYQEEDGIVDSTCVRCGRLIASSNQTMILSALESAHVCSAKDLERAGESRESLADSAG